MMETMEDILKELEMVIAKRPDQWLYDICRVRQPVHYFEDEAIKSAKIEHVTLRSLTIRLDRASMNIRRSLGHIYELSKVCLKTRDPYKLSEALYKILKEARPLSGGEEE